ELLRQAGEVADTVAVAVGEGADVHLVYERVFVPEPIGHVESRRSRASGRPRACRGADDENVRHPLARIQLHEIPFTAPGVLRAVEQVLDDVALARADA